MAFLGDIMRYPIIPALVILVFVGSDSQCSGYHSDHPPFPGRTCFGSLPAQLPLA